MLDRQRKLNEVYEHLHNYHGIHTKKEFADILKYARAYISSALNGNEKNLTDKLFTNICEAFPGIFNLEYFLSGEGMLLTAEEDARVSEVEQRVNQPPADLSGQYANMLELYARMIRGIDDLRQSLKEELAAVQTLKADLTQARNDFQAATKKINYIINNNSYSYGSIAAEDLNPQKK